MNYYGYSRVQFEQFWRKRVSGERVVAIQAVDDDYAFMDWLIILTATFFSHSGVVAWETEHLSWFGDRAVMRCWLLYVARKAYERCLPHNLKSDEFKRGLSLFLVVKLFENPPGAATEEFISLSVQQFDCENDHQLLLRYKRKANDARLTKPSSKEKEGKP